MASNRSSSRTPRKTKLWSFNSETPVTGTALVTSTQAQVVKSDLLAGMTAETGLNKPYGLTVMRIIGDIQLTQSTANAQSGRVDIFYGIGWLNSRVAGAGSGDAQIPRPWFLGAREASWIYSGHLWGQMDTGVASSGSTNPLGDPNIKSVDYLDVLQMRKQPTADSQLALVANVVLSTANIASVLSVSLGIMVALP